MTSAVGTVEACVVPPREWWQRWAERRAAWWAARPVLAGRWARIRAIGLWVALAWVVALWVLWPELRSSLLAYVGGLWVVVAWFFLARTKTLTWAGYLRFYAACLGWGYVLAVVLRVATTVIAGLDPSNAGPSIAIAGIAEESLKLVPVVVVALAAPRRVARFATMDWVLLGVASGTAFLVVEESARRVSLWVVDNLGTVIARAHLDHGQTPDDWPQFRAWPVPARWTDLGAAFGGHAIMTAIVTGLIGLAVVLWHTARDRPASRRRPVRALAVVVPVVALAIAAVDHAGWNAHLGYGLVTLRSDTPRWLDPEWTTVPWWLRWPWSALGHGQGRVWVFWLVVTACLLVDAARLARQPGANLTGRPLPGWISRATARLATALGAAPVWVRASATRLTYAPGALVWVTGRDLAEQIAAHARAAGEPRRAAMARGAATSSAQRAVREVTYETLAGPVHVRRRRWLAGGALGLLFIAALVIAPAVAADIGTSPYLLWKPGWLAGAMDNLGTWWHGLSIGQQLAIGVGIAALVALSGGSLALAFGVAGVATWALDKSHGIATFTRNPAQATTEYVLTATPGQYIADTVGVVLTFVPGNFAGAAVGRKLAPAVADAAWAARAHPREWLASVTERLRWSQRNLADDSGAVNPGVVASGRQAGDPASLGWATTTDYRTVFERAHPGLNIDDLVIHHAVEQSVLTRYPGLVNKYELHSIENLRGIPRTANSKVHLSTIRKSWNAFYRQFEELGRAPTRQELLDHASQVDDELGHLFVPRER